MRMGSRECGWGLTAGFKLGEEKGQGVKGFRDVKAWQNRGQGNLRD